MSMAAMYWTVNDEKMVAGLIRYFENEIETLKKDKFISHAVVADICESYTARIDWLKYLRDRMRKTYQ